MARPLGRGDMRGRAHPVNAGIAKFHLIRIGRNLRDRRLQLDIAASELAAAADCDEFTIYNVEQGRRLPSIGLLVRLALALGLHPSELL